MFTTHALVRATRTSSSIRRPFQCLISAPRQQNLHTSRVSLARKDTMDKDSMKVEPNEYSKSGSDNESAAVEEAAFDPNKTSPEEAHDTAGKEAGEQGVSASGSQQQSDKNNPLNASPANQEISQPRGQQEGGAEGSPNETGSGQGGRQQASGGGSGPKMGGGKSG